MGWKSVIGQERIKQLLMSSLESGRLAHAYLFIGEAGLGKYPVALELAKCVNCRKSPYDACGVCPDCKKMNDLQHPNLYLIYPLPRGKNEEPFDPPLAKLSDEDIKSLRGELKRKSENPYYQIRLERASDIKVNSIREVRRQAAYTSFDTGRKVFIILEAEKMNDESANAFLKTLEEPTPDTLFILISQRQEALLPTIVSRCQVIRFDSLSETDILNALVNQYDVKENDALAAARLANGSITRAVQYVEPDTMNRRKKAIEFLRTILSRQRKDINESIIKLDSEYERRDFTEMFLFLEQWFRDAMRAREGAEKRADLPDRDMLVKFNANFPSWEYAGAIGVLERSISLLDKNVYIPLILINAAHNLRRAVGDRKVN